MMILMVMRLTARVNDVKITDADGLPVKNGSILPVNSSLTCSTPYDLNLTFLWINVYSRSQIVIGNTLILSEVGFFVYLCYVFRMEPRLGLTWDSFIHSTCNTSRTFYATVSSLGIT